MVDVENHQQSLAPAVRLALNADFPNPHAREHMALARLLAEVFAASHLLNDELLAFHGAEHFGGHVRALHVRCAELRVAIAADSQYAIERNLLARRHVAVRDQNFLTFFNSMLVASVTNDRVHVCTLMNSVSRRGAEIAEKKNTNLH